MARYLDSLVTVLRLEITVVQWHNVNDKGNINILSAAEEVIWKLWRKSEDNSEYQAIRVL